MRKRTYNVRLIRASWPYTVPEIADLFGVHKNAPLRWLRQGLHADRSRRPFLIRGDELARFLSARKQAKRRKCAATEFFCFKCRSPRGAYLGIADVAIESAAKAASEGALRRLQHAHEQGAGRARPAENPRLV